MAPAVQTLIHMLERAAQSKQDTGIICYSPNDSLRPHTTTYAELLDRCSKNAIQLQRRYGLASRAVVLLHFSNHFDNILWYWSVLLAGGVPALSPPLPNGMDQRRQHLTHLSRLFDGPICLARRASFAELSACGSLLSLLAVDDLESEEGVVLANDVDDVPAAVVSKPGDVAALMLTSGSTGNAKAVQLTHGQVLASLASKDSVAPGLNEEGTALLNWIGMDHVAALVETHLLAVYRCRDQVHVPAEDVVADPLLMLHMVTKHKVARTVAPNFLLAGLLKAMKRRCGAAAEQLAEIDLSSLMQLVSGGQENPVQLCVELDDELQRLGAPAGVLQPAFGMTETCAGCTYSTNCPASDVGSSMGFASLGRPVKGLDMRVVPRDNDESLPSHQQGRRGTLQIRGPMVFSGYYNNPKATAEAFTGDGWFDTGDEALIDDNDSLHLVGRIKDLIRINGVGIIPSDLESELDVLAIPGVVEGSYAAFGYRPRPTDDESLAILYLPVSHQIDGRKKNATDEAIADSIWQSHRVWPYVLPVGESGMQRSTLGKVSRGKLRRALEDGRLTQHEAATGSAITFLDVEPRTEVEAQLLGIFRETFEHSLGISGDLVGIRTPWYSLGTTSIVLIRLSHKIKAGLNLSEPPLDKLLSCSTIEELAVELPQPERRKRGDSVTSIVVSEDGEASPEAYNPVKKLRTEGSRAPLWLFHPGVGEVLVFINLAKRIDDRPVYALRARGFNPGERFFESIEEAVEVYYHAIKKQQPHGPYALSGYSFGAMLAFETAKRLNSDGKGDQVQFLASLNLPPHIKSRMRELDWRACALHLGHFLGLLPDPDNEVDRHTSGSNDQGSVVRSIFAAAPSSRLKELSLIPEDFSQWVDLAHAMQSMARDYEPTGNVPSMDVFYCQPLAVVAQTKQQWLDVHLRRWHEVASDVRFHEVRGEHYTMIDTEHAEDFMSTFCVALAARGL